jgi:hypothetical protein
MPSLLVTSHNTSAMSPALYTRHTHTHTDANTHTHSAPRNTHANSTGTNMSRVVSPPRLARHVASSEKLMWVMAKNQQPCTRNSTRRGGTCELLLRIAQALARACRPAEMHRHRRQPSLRPTPLPAPRHPPATRLHQQRQALCSAQTVAAPAAGPLRLHSALRRHRARHGCHAPPQQLVQQAV